MDVIYISRTNNTEIEEIAVEFLSRWGHDKNTENFKTKLEFFIAQIEGNKKLENIFIELIKRYEYYSRKAITDWLLEVFVNINTNLKLDKRRTIYSRIEDDSKIDSSNTMLEEFKIINEISNEFSHDLADLENEDIDNISNFIFIDDIIGSGNTVKKFFELHLDKFRKVDTYIYCTVILSDAKHYLNNFFEANEIQCVIINKSEHQKAFFKDYIFCEDCLENEEVLRVQEKRLINNNNKMVLGYKNSQALVSFYRNTPNNTISSFWIEEKKWKGLFPRNKDAPDFISKKRERTRAAYNIGSMAKKKYD